MRVHRYVSVAGITKSKTGDGECKPLYFSLINIDSTEGNSILLYAVENTTWINFTISQFSVLIKKQQSPLKKSIPAKEAKKGEFPCRSAIPQLCQFKDMHGDAFGPFLLYTYSATLNRTFQSWKCWLGLLFFLYFIEIRLCRRGSRNTRQKRGMRRYCGRWTLCGICLN